MWNIKRIKIYIYMVKKNYYATENRYEPDPAFCVCVCVY